MYVYLRYQIESTLLWYIGYLNPCAAELFVSIFRHLKLELLTQIPALNDEKYVHFRKTEISQIELFD